MRRRFFADAVVDGRAEMAGAGAAHLARVLRAQPGQEYELACGGRVYLGRIVAASAHRVNFEILSELPAPAPEPALTVAACIFKFDRFEWMIEKSTELGAVRLIPVVSRRTEMRLAAAAPQRRARWRLIALEAAQQSRRAAVPEIAAPQPLAALLASPPAGRRVVMWEALAGAAGAEAAGAGDRLRAGAEGLVLLSGPEGGFAHEEFEAAAAAGFAPVSLGPRILRCETAILAALAAALI